MVTINLSEFFYASELLWKAAKWLLLLQLYYRLHYSYTKVILHLYLFYLNLYYSYIAVTLHVLLNILQV